MLKLSQAQINGILFCLDYADDKMGVAGSNDAMLENTPENMELLKSVIENSDSPEDEVTVSSDGKHLYATDFMILSYCRNVLTGKIATLT